MAIKVRGQAGLGKRGCRRLMPMAYYAKPWMEARMVTRNVVLTDHQAAFLDGLVADGQYQNVSEAMRAGLRLLERNEAEFQRIRAGVLEGLAQYERGEVIEGDYPTIITNAFDRGVARAKTEAEAKAKADTDAMK